MLTGRRLRGGQFMDQRERVVLLQHCLKTRNIFRVRELLIENLRVYSEDKAFLIYCYELVKKDKLIFQRHDHELLDSVLEKWSELDYQLLLQKLTKNFSQMRYYLAIQLCSYFYELEQKEKERKEAEEAEALLKLEAEAESKKDKKIKIKIKRLKREKKKRTAKEKHKLAGIHTTGYLLILMILQLIYGFKI